MERNGDRTVSFTTSIAEWIVYLLFASFYAVVCNFNWWQTMLAMIFTALFYRFWVGFMRGQRETER